ncbi:MAG: hypothetical protein C75L2_00820002 [Leptospirillum sp. Group II 'C75']|nr:MAG: hypothetical protein C75L2_00820002 [Leptospirillum sp. Group II 'C75']
MGILLKNVEGNGIEAWSLSPKATGTGSLMRSRLSGASFPPETAVLERPQVLQKLKRILVKDEVKFCFGEPVTGIEVAAGRLTAPAFEHSLPVLNNCAGAYADKIVKMFGLSRDHVAIRFKGISFEQDHKKDGLVQESLYPVPDLAFSFMGVHLTRNAWGISMSDRPPFRPSGGRTIGESRG